MKIEWYDDYLPGRLWGWLALDGFRLEVVAIQIQEDADDMIATNPAWQGELETILWANDHGCPEDVALKGRPGRWLVCGWSNDSE